MIRGAIALGVFSLTLLSGADFSTYRGFEFGKPLAAAAKRAETNLSEARVVHRRPAVIQELEWRPPYSYKEDSKKGESVREGMLRFYNDELFQIIATYDREKVEGISEADMVSAISLTYGTATRPKMEIAYHSNYGETAPVLARWETEDYAYSLVRTGDRSSYALILSSRRLTALADLAIVESGRLDALEAPQRAIDLLKKQEAENRVALDKARAANLLNFRP